MSRKAVDGVWGSQIVGKKEGGTYRRRVVLGTKRGVGEEKRGGVCVLWDRYEASAVAGDTRTPGTEGCRRKGERRDAHTEGPTQ